MYFRIRRFLSYRMKLHEDFDMSGVAFNIRDSFSVFQCIDLQLDMLTYIVLQIETVSFMLEAESEGCTTLPTYLSHAQNLCRKQS